MNTCPWTTKLSCNLSHLSWTGCPLTHQATRLGVCSLSDESGTMWSGPTWVTWRSGTCNPGSQSYYTAFFLPACTCCLPPVSGKRKTELILVCGNMSQSEQYSTTAPVGDISWWAVNLVVHFAKREKWPDMWFHSNSWAVANALAEQSGTWKEHD